MGEADRALAAGRVAGGRAQLADLRGATNRRELDPAGAGLEKPVDRTAVELRDAREGREADRGSVRGQLHRLLLAELRVLEVDQAEVKARRGRDVQHLGRRKLYEQAEVEIAQFHSVETGSHSTRLYPAYVCLASRASPPWLMKREG